MSDKYEMNGQIKVIMDLQTFDSGFTKREFVVTTPGAYPQDIKLETVKEKCSILDTYREGEHVKVSFNLRGNEYNDRYFVNLQAWKIEYAEGKQSMDEAKSEGDKALSASEQAVADKVKDSVGGDDPEDILPF